MRIIARLNVGGPALHCLLLSEGLLAEGFQTTLVCGRMAEGEESFEELHRRKIPAAAPGFEVHRLGSLRRLPSLLGDLRTLYELWRLMRTQRPQIVHTHTAKAGVLGRMAAFFAGVPVIVHTFHGHVLHGYFGPFLSWLVQLTERALARISSAIVTLSPGLRDELSLGYRVAPPERFRVIPLGRPLAEFLGCESQSGALRAELGLPPERRLIGCVGRLVPIKDHETLLRAIAEPVLVEQPLQLLIIGDGELRERLEGRVAELGLAERVSFLGWRSDLARIYADLELLVLSSKNEGTPLAMIEAFAAGVPVVATRVGGVGDMLHREPNPWTNLPEGVEGRAEGLLVAPSDPASLALALAAALEQGEGRRAAGLAARESGRDYSADRLVERMAALYRELLGLPVPAAVSS